MIALLLGKTGLNIPFSAPFDMETLDNVFQVGDSAAMNSVRLCPDAAFVLLAMARVLLHQQVSPLTGGDCFDGGMIYISHEMQGLILETFFLYMYYCANGVASELIDYHENFNPYPTFLVNVLRYTF